MKKIVFYGPRYSGRSSTLVALAKAKKLDVIDELWDEEVADIKRIFIDNQQIEVISCLSPYRVRAAYKKLFKDATDIFYFIPFPSKGIYEEEFARNVNLLPEIYEYAESNEKGFGQVPWTTVFSKIDRLPNNPYLEALPSEYLNNYLSVSAFTGEGLDDLWNHITK